MAPAHGFRSASRHAVLGFVGRIGSRFGHKLLPILPPECDPATLEIIERVRPYTLTSSERIMALCEALSYLTRAEVPGAIVECGVGRGGSMMAAALALADLGVSDRDFHLYDTFTRQPPPGERDELPAELSGLLSDFSDEGVDDPQLARLRVEEVRGLIESTGYPPERLQLVAGLVEETIPERAPEQIALCRLDTDWHGSTAHAMRHLYPRISPGGVLLIDDYGILPGARLAVDEYLAEQDSQVMLVRIDESARIAVLPRG